MSGSSRSSFGGPSPGGSIEDPCSSLHLIRILEAPDPLVVRTLSVDEVLDVELDEGPPPVVKVLKEYRVAGSVVPTARLLECLRQEETFEALVLSVTGGAVRLEVRAPS